MKKITKKKKKEKFQALNDFKQTLEKFYIKLEWSIEEINKFIKRCITRESNNKNKKK